MSFATPLRYPGGKGRLGNWLAGVLKANGLTGGTYAEAYAGGAGAGIFLLTEGHVSQIVINDIDPAIYLFWWAVKNDNERLAQMVRDAPITLEQRAKSKDILRNIHSHDKTDVAFATFFLNRTSRSGILRGGPIGGALQQGKYLLDARFNKEGLAERIERIGKLSERIEVLNVDALELISAWGKRKQQNMLVYCDPPYFEKGYQLYKNFYTSEDHLAVAKAIRKLRSPWLVTYDDCDEIEQLYKYTPMMRFSLFYSAHQSRTRATELLYYDNIILPEAPYLHR